MQKVVGSNPISRFRLYDESLDEVERGIRDLAPAVVDGQRVPRFGTLVISVTPGLRFCLL